MYVKVYEYQIQESKTADFLAYNRLSQALYEKYLPVEMLLLKKEGTDTEWLELNAFASKEQFDSSSPLIETDPGHAELFQRFSDCIVPGTPLTESSYTAASGLPLPFRFQQGEH